MPMTMYEMALVMNEAANNKNFSSFYINNIEPMFIPEDINEAVAFANSVIMAEAVEMVEFDYTIDTYLSEAVMKSPDTVMAISEASLGGLKDAIVKFFTKLKAAVIAIINRMKEFFAKMTRKTDKFVELIVPRLKAAKEKNPNLENTRVNIHMWDFSYLDKFATAIDEVAIGDKKVGKYLSAKNRVQFNDKLTKDVKNNSDELNAAKNELNELILKINEQHEEEIKNGIKAAANTIGIGNVDTMEDFWSAIDSKVTGGEKTDHAASDVTTDKMVTFLKEYPTKYKAFEDTYTKYLKQINDDQKEWVSMVDKAIKNFKELGTINPDKALSTNPDKFSNANKSYATIYEKYMRAQTSGLTKMYTFKNSLASGIISRGLSYMKTAAQEYMTALQKCAGNTKGKGDYGEDQVNV